MADNESFEFDIEFEFKILALCVRDAKFLSSYRSLIDSSYFNGIENFLIASSILFYYDKYDKICDKADLRQTITNKGKQTSNEASAQKAIKSLEILYSLPIEEATMAGDHIIEFVDQSEMAKAVIESAGLLDGEEADKKKLVMDIIEAAYKKTEIVSHIGMTQLDYLDEMVDNLSKPPSELSVVPTGFGHLDSIMKFKALAAGTIAEIQGPQKRFKSGLLCNFAHNAARAPYNKNVVIYTMELSEEDYLERLNCRTSKMSLDDIKKNPKEFKRRVKTKLANGTIGGQIIVKYFEGDDVKLSNLKSHYESLKKNGFKADLVIFDYLDLVVPDKVFKGEHSKRLGIDSVYRSARNWGAKENFAMWTAGHTSRMSSKLKIIGDSHSAESHGKQRILDFCITINQTKIEHFNNELRLHVIANRGGPMWGFIRVRTIPNKYYAKSFGYLEPDSEDAQIEEDTVKKKAKKKIKEPDVDV